MDYEPNPTQSPIVDTFINGGRFILVSGGERSGKSYTGAATVGLDMGPRLDAEGEIDKSERLYWIVADGYRSCRPEFRYIHDALMRIGGVRDSSMPKDDNSPWSLSTPWGVRLETRTSSDAAKLASFTVHGALMAEANAQEEEAFRKLRGRISETRGWLMLIGTLEESTPWYVDLMLSWRGENTLGGHSFSLPTWSNTAVYPLGENDPEIILLRNTLPEDYFAFRYAAKPMKSTKLVIPEFDRKLHVRSLSVDPDLPVELAIDPGTHSFAIGFCQVLGDRTNVLGAIYEKNAIVQDLIPKIRNHPLWKYVNPSNAGVIDVAGKQRHANKSVVQIFMEDGIILRSKKHFLKASVNALRNRLRVSPVTGVSNIYFDTAIRSGYTVSGKKVIATGPLTEFDLWKNNDLGEPDKLNCDFTKALAYFILDHFGQDTFGGSKQKQGRYGARIQRGWRKQ